MATQLACTWFCWWNSGCDAESAFLALDKVTAEKRGAGVFRIGCRPDWADVWDWCDVVHDASVGDHDALMLLSRYYGAGAAEQLVYLAWDPLGPTVAFPHGNGWVFCGHDTTDGKVGPVPSGDRATNDEEDE